MRNNHFLPEKFKNLPVDLLKKRNTDHFCGSEPIINSSSSLFRQNIFLVLNECYILTFRRKFRLNRRDEGAWYYLN